MVKSSGAGTEPRGAPLYDGTTSRTRDRHARLSNGDRAGSPCRRSNPKAGLPDGADRRHAVRLCRQHSDLRRPAGYHHTPVFHHGVDWRNSGRTPGRFVRPRRQNYPGMHDRADRIGSLGPEPGPGSGNSFPTVPTIRGRASAGACRDLQSDVKFHIGAYHWSDLAIGSTFTPPCIARYPAGPWLEA